VKPQPIPLLEAAMKPLRHPFRDLEDTEIMSSPTSLHDDVIAYAATRTVDSPEKVSEAVEALVEGCQERARTAAAEETTLTGSIFAPTVVGIDHTIVPTLATTIEYLVSVVVTIEFRAIL
jgi:hypothetical protein